MINETWFTQELDKVHTLGTNRRLRTITSAPGRTLVVEGSEYLNFASNNYLSLAYHSSIIEQTQQSLSSKGSGSTGSRLLGGNYDEHRTLEEKIATLKNSEGALLFNSGYNANIGLLTTFAQSDTHIFSDKLNHASIVDGIQLSGANLHRYQHCDMAHLEILLKKYSGSKIIITDALFSMDGTIAPLETLCELAERYEAMVIVDEAHSDGIYGIDGHGLVSELHLTHKVDLVMGTFGKAYGCYGAVVTGKKILIEYLIQKCRSFTYTTALPPFMISAISAALDTAQAEPWRRETLLEKSALVRTRLTEKGFDLGGSVSHIIPIIIGSNATAVATAQELEKMGLWVPAIREPTVPHGTARLRVNINADHTDQDIEQLITALCKTTWYTEHGKN
ncbi:MAG: 8-amino-7-oxononanoate synthase [Fibrobacterales bacterium]